MKIARTPTRFAMALLCAAVVSHANAQEPQKYLLGRSDETRTKSLLRRNIHPQQMLGVRKKPDGPTPSPRQPPVDRSALPVRLALGS